MPGRLYIVATPIGNLKDITYRAVEILSSVDIIAAEDTRTTRKLLTHYGITGKRLISYFEHNERERATRLLDLINEGMDVALVSEAGTPAISDPAYRVVSLAVKEGIKVVPIPGPSALTAALSISGLPTDRFMFVGFLPDKGGKRKRRLEELKDVDATLIFFVSKWKIKRILDEMYEAFGERRCCLMREATKLNEEILYENLSSLVPLVQKTDVKGEVTLIVAPPEG